MTPSGIEPATFRFVAQHLNHCATAVPSHCTARPSLDGRAVLCCGLEKNGMVSEWHRRGMASVNQTRPHCVNQMGKTHSKLLAALHGLGTARVRHGHGILCVNRPLGALFYNYFLRNLNKVYKLVYKRQVATASMSNRI